jgi:hypothetical protein
MPGFPHLSTRRSSNPFALPQAAGADGIGSSAIVFAATGTGASLSAAAGSAAIVFAASAVGDSSGGAVTPRQRIARRRVRYLVRIAA